MVFAGVGSPLKKLEFDLEILNFARRIAEAIVTKKEKKGITDDKIDPTYEDGAWMNKL